MGGANALGLGIHSALRKYAVHEPLPAAISIQPQRFAALVAADEIIAADVLAVPPAALDALGTRFEPERCLGGPRRKRIRLGKQPQRTNRVRSIHPEPVEGL